jgi:CRP/FNR family transcriptional regulator
MGSYLGLKLETVSRMFSHFQECGLITTQNRYVHILERPKLARLAGRNVPPDIHEMRLLQ